MRKVMIALGLLVSVPLTAAGRTEPVSTGEMPSLEQMLQARSDGRYQEALESKPLFFGLPDSAAHDVRFVVSVGGRPYLEETISVPASEGKGQPAVELLARDPRRLERLYTLAANKVLPVNLEIFVDGAGVRGFEFDAFVAYNRGLKVSGMRPQAGESKLRVQAVEPPSADAQHATAAPQPDGPCEDQCWWEYQSCINNCSPCPGCPIPVVPDLPYPGDCTHCDSQYSYCLSSCPPPCNPGDIIGDTTYTESELVAINGYWLECLRRFWNPDPMWGELFQWTEWVFKVTTYRRITYCGGSTSTSVVSVTYASNWCQYPVGACVYPWGYAWQSCF
jgi:hypothetical protein